MPRTRDLCPCGSGYPFRECHPLATYRRTRVRSKVPPKARSKVPPNVQPNIQRRTDLHEGDDDVDQILITMCLATSISVFAAGAGPVHPELGPPKDIAPIGAPLVPGNSPEKAKIPIHGSTKARVEKIDTVKASAAETSVSLKDVLPQEGMMSKLVDASGRPLRLTAEQTARYVASKDPHVFAERYVDALDERAQYVLRPGELTVAEFSDWAIKSLDRVTELAEPLLQLREWKEKVRKHFLMIANERYGQISR